MNFPGMATRSAAPGDAEPPPSSAGKADEGGEEAAALEWLETTTAHIWVMWGRRHKNGKDW